MLRALVAVLLVGCPLAAAAPEQVHLGYPTSDPSTAVSVHWIDAAPIGEPDLVLQTPEGARIVRGEVVPGPSAGVAYEARITGLSPGTTYAYALGGRSFAFRTPAPSDEVTFVALGDMATTPRSAATVKTLLGIGPDLVLHAGDISYAEHDPVTWKAWFDLVEPVAANVPWITAIGNHEANVAGAGGTPNVPDPIEQAFYKQRFGLPGNELYYSFDHGPLHVVALDTYSDASGVTAAQRAWLDADLAANADAPWTVVFLHEPPYSSNSHGSSPRVQAAFVALFDKHGVDLVIAAHDHGYERFTQLVGGKVVHKGDNVTYAAGAGTVYLVTGGAGAELYDDWRPVPVRGSVQRSSTWHVTAFTATADRLEGRYVATDGSAFQDGFAIVRAASDDADGGVAGAVVGREVPAAAPLFALALAAALVVFRSRRA